MSILSRFQNLPLAFGGASISGEGGGYGLGPISEKMALDLLLDAYERGVRVFDTAPIYGFGLSEERLGMAFQKKRENVFLISKSGVTWHSNKRVNMTNDPKIAEKMLHESLKRLQSEYIDLYMVHWPDAKVDIRRTLEPLIKAKNQGKILQLGLCNTTEEDLKKAMEVETIAVVQSEYNLFNQQAKLLFPLLNQANIAFMSWGTLDKGILSGTVVKGRQFDKVDCRSWAPWWKAQDLQKKLVIVHRLSDILNDYSCTLVEFALGLNFSEAEMAMALCGPRNSEQLAGLIRALEHLPSPKTILEIMSRLS